MPEVPAQCEAAREGAAREEKVTLDSIAKRVVEISTLPQVALRVMEVVKDSEAGAAELQAVVEGDPALCMRALRLVNSTSSGIRAPITTLHQAISFLGFSKVRNLALTASVANVFKNDTRIGNYRRRDLWRHLVSVGICARFVASRCGLHEFENAFVAGLVHDIGLVIIDQHAHAHFVSVIHGLSADQTLQQVEHKVLGFDHCMLGERIASAWRFPEVTRAAIRHHHESHHYTGPGDEIVRCVEIANAICTIKGITSVGIKVVRPPLEAFKAVGFRKNDIVVLARDLEPELERNRDLFAL